MLSGQEALYLDQVAGPSALQMHMWAGQRIPLHATSNGKVLLAFAAPGTAARLLTEPLSRFTDNTIASLAELEDELDAVRRRGLRDGGGRARARADRGVGAGLRDRRLRRRGGQRVRSELPVCPPSGCPRSRPPSIEAAFGISRRLGWHGVPHDPMPNRVPAVTA